MGLPSALRLPLIYTHYLADTIENARDVGPDVILMVDYRWLALKQRWANVPNLLDSSNPPPPPTNSSRRHIEHNPTWRPLKRK